MSFSYQKLIGEGHFAEVYYERFNGSWAAVKLFKEEYPEINDRVRRELGILKGFVHEHVVNFLGIRRADRDCRNQIALVMEYCPGGTLLKALTAHKINDINYAFSIIHQMASGLAFVHAIGIPHGNLKPNNILFRDKELTRVVIADFGISGCRKYASYMAAQLFQPNDETYRRSSDVFSLGLVACCVLVNEAPSDKAHMRTLADEALEMLGRSKSTRSQKATLQNAISTKYYERPYADDFAEEFEVGPASNSWICTIS